MQYANESRYFTTYRELVSVLIRKQVLVTFPSISRNFQSWQHVKTRHLLIVSLSRFLCKIWIFKSKTESIKYRSGEHEISSEENTDYFSCGVKQVSQKPKLTKRRWMLRWSKELVVLFSNHGSMLFFVIQWLERHIRSRHEIDLLRCDRESRQ